MIALLFTLSAWACPPTSSEIGRARAAYEDAEVEIAAEIVRSASEQLACQTSVVARDVLLELFRLDALVSLARADDSGAVEATMRAVTIDPLATPPSFYGPELVTLHRNWAGRMSDKRVTVSVLGGGLVFIDGEPLRHGQQITVVRGKHLVQIDGQGGLTTIVDTLDADRSVVTGVPSPEAQLIAQDPNPSVLLPEGAPKVVHRRLRPAALWITGVGLAVVGAGVAVLGGLQEQAFHDRTYTDFREVDKDAVRIRVLYASGYGTAAVGGIVLTVATIGLPKKKR